jgi:hypothetical protein
MLYPSEGVKGTSDFLSIRTIDRRWRLCLEKSQAKTWHNPSKAVDVEKQEEGKRDLDEPD